MLRPLLFCVSFAFLGFHGCQTVPTPPAPAETKSGPALSASESEFKGQIEAQSLAANYASQTLPDSNAKVAISGPVGVISDLTKGASTQKQRDDAMAPVLLALQGKLTEAQTGWAKAASDAEALRVQVTTLEQTVKQEQISAAAELTSQLTKARSDAEAAAEAQERRLIGFIFFGGGALCLLATAGVLYFSATVPQLGPRVALFTGGAGVVLIGSGTAILALLSHPAVIWWGLGISTALLACAAVAVWYNHLHALASGQIVQAPVTAPVVLPAAPKTT